MSSLHKHPHRSGQPLRLRRFVWDHGKVLQSPGGVCDPASPVKVRAAPAAAGLNWNLRLGSLFEVHVIKTLVMTEAFTRKFFY